MDYTISLTKDELDLIGTAISELPFKVAAPLYGKLRSQAMAQEAKTRPAEQPAEAAEAA